MDGDCSSVRDGTSEDASHLLAASTSISSPPVSSDSYASDLEKREIDDEPQRKHSILSLLKDWTFELLSILLTLTLLASIIAVLSHYDGDSIPHWQYGITLNTLAAVFTTISTFTLLAPLSAAIGQIKWLRVTKRSQALDEFCAIHNASRGFQGSLMLLGQKQGGILAAVGAFLTILVLTINPFVQQVIAYAPALNSTTAASLPILRDTWMTNAAAVPMYMTAAVWDGTTFDSFMTLNVTPACPSLNCTWSAYQTLGMCSQCTDISGYISNSSDGTKYTLPNGMWVDQYNLTSESPYTVPNHTGPVTVMVVNNTLNGYSSLVYNSTTGPEKVLDFFILANNNYYTNFGLSDCHNSQPSAYECMLSLCVQTMTASVENGVFVDTIVSTWTNITTDATLVDYDEDARYNIYPPDTNLTFSIDGTFTDQVSSLLSGLFVGTVFSAPSGGNITSITGDMTNNIWQGIGQIFSASQGFPNLTALMSNIASSSTVTMRQKVTSPSNYQYSQSFTYGAAFFNQYNVSIRWAWLTPSIVITLFSMLFFAVIVFQTYKLKLEPWKQSILPILYHGLAERPPASEYTQLRRLQDMATKAQGTIVELEDGELKSFKKAAPNSSPTSSGWFLNRVVYGI